jgi:hypothetical protein
MQPSERAPALILGCVSHYATPRSTTGLNTEDQRTVDRGGKHHGSVHWILTTACTKTASQENPTRRQA